MDPALRSSLRAGFDAMSRGDFLTIQPSAERLLADASPEGQAWRAALTAARWLAGLVGEPPALAPLVAALGDGGEAKREAGVSACWRLGLSALLAGDGPAFDRVLALHSTVDGSEPGPALRLARIWSRLLAGDTSEPLAEDARQAGAEAATREDAQLVVEAAALRALLALGRGDVEEATKLARRGSRMARTEGIPQAEYLANIVLARVRRLSGSPYLATRILSGLAKVAPPAWHGWLAWEMTMAGGLQGAMELTRRRALPEDALPTRLQAVISAAGAGDRDRFEANMAGLETCAAPCAYFTSDVRLLRAALDPDEIEDAVPEAVTSFRRGLSHDPPMGLDGLAGPESVEGPLACVCVGPGMSARRVLRLGAGLFGGPELEKRSLEGIARPGRTEASLCVLAFEGVAGMPEGDLFTGAYGFDYERDLHRGILGVLVHRARARVEGVALVHRDERHCSLEPTERLILPDPRCASPVDAQVLQFVARKRQSTAKDAAKALGISLRSAQAALQALVTDGACDRERAGRQINYVVEDTTFQEPTQH